MRSVCALALGASIIALSGSAFTARADEKKKEETKKLEGKLTCTKCALGETSACEHALVLKVDGKEVKYYLKDKGGKEKYHSKCCSDPVDAIVTGKVVEKDKKLFIEAPKVEIK